MTLGLRAAAAALLAILPLPAHAEGKLVWRTWSADLFATAKAEQKLVLLDLEAVWCHWCHVMEETTYSDPKVVELLGSKFITVRVDQDANPDLSNRYGDWGWPATILFAADGTELAKRRGYIPPEGMASLLQAFIDDPTPGPSAAKTGDVAPAKSPFLGADKRADLKARFADSYDKANGGWGDVHKYIETDSMDWALLETERGNADAIAMARATLDAALNLIDPVWGGIYQYSDAVNWKSPHYEKIMWYQAQALRQYSVAHARFEDDRYLKGARSIYRYLTERLTSPDGAFFTSQDADVDRALDGNAFYAMPAEERAKLGRQPRIDTNIYARENGWAVSGLAAYYNLTNDPDVLERAERAARFILEKRRLPTGGFRHGESDRGGPFLGDTLAMGQAALDLYASSGKREWLTVAGEAGDFIGATFLDKDGGFLTSATPESAKGAFLKPTKTYDEQVLVARFANRLHRYIGKQSHRELAEHAGRYLASDAIITLPRPLPGVLIVDRELSEEPTHITIVGSKDHPRTRGLHAAARLLPAIYKRLDLWDKSEGPLPNSDVTYPELDRPAAFACTNRICSLPIFSTAELPLIVAKLLENRPQRK